jgi:hypothetical protein
MLEGINYWDQLRDSPSQMETCFAIFANVLELDDSGQPVNEKYAEKRAATWIYQSVLHRHTAARPAGSRAMGDQAVLMRHALGSHAGSHRDERPRVAPYMPGRWTR